MQITAGKPYPLGATWDGLGVNFALFSEHATKVELCLFNSNGSQKESARIELPEYNNHVFHGFVRDLMPGQVYGYRVYGPYDPGQGLRFNHNKILCDPYAKAMIRDAQWDDSLFGYVIGDEREDLSMDERDSAPFAPLSAVIDPSFVWGDDKRPEIPWNKTVIYEAHVKAMTMLHPDVPPELRGTYAGFASDPIVKHLTNLGITSVELMPVHHRVESRILSDKGLSDYWGYNTLSFFAPDIRFATVKGGVDHIQEFKMMVRKLHAAGIEVILDVVYNHTVEGSHLGPTLSFRGIDNTSYYRTLAENPRFYMDYTGCGNTLNMMHPRVIQLIMDSLRYWIEEMHVDGFRFDLAAALARELYDVDNLSAFFDVIQQDPVISKTKLIAEPWDIGEGGYQVGNFPVLWTEWNGKYRDCVRRYIKGDKGQLGELASRLTGSSDLYEHSGRRPHASINFITCHDGFSLQDLVSHNEKHNQSNGEDNRDGESNNDSWNCGYEGQTDDPAVKALRYRQKRNLITCLLLSIGVPMLRGGDELGHSQNGNNNNYCHDDERSWYKWELSDQDEQFLQFVRKLVAIRKNELVIRRKKFFKGNDIGSDQPSDLSWLRPDGAEMAEPDWMNQECKTIGLFLDGTKIKEFDEAANEQVTGHTLLLLFNASHLNVSYVLPQVDGQNIWRLVLDTTETPRQLKWTMGRKFKLAARSIVLMELVADENAKREPETSLYLLPSPENKSA